MGEGTLSRQLWESELARRDAEIQGLREQVADERETARSQRADLFAKVDALERQLADERVTSAKSLSSAAAGGGGTATIVLVLDYFLQGGLL